MNSALKPQERAISKSTATIEIRRHLARIPAEAFANIQQDYEIPRIRTTWNKDDGFEQHTERLCSHKYDDGCVYFPAGLVHQVRRELKREGNAVLIQDRTIWMQFERADDSRLYDSYPLPFQTEFLASIQCKPRGQVLLKTMSDAIALLDLLEKYYNQENILVVTKNSETAERTAQRMRTSTGRKVTWGSHFERDGSPQLHVDSIASFIGRDMMDWAVVVVVGLEAARAQTSIEQLVCMDESLWFAFLPTQRPFDREDELHLEALFGREIYCLDDQQSCDTGVSVLFAGPCTYRAGRTTDPLQRKRQNIWNNDHRNRVIAETARAVRSRNRRSLELLGIEIGDKLQSLSDNDQPGVVITVDSLEHGRALAKHLPDWPLFDANGMEEPDLDYLLEVDQGIVTRLRANQKGVSAEVIIRAEGTAIGWNPDLGPHFFATGPHMMVVDIVDDFDDQVQRDVQRRLKAYMERGWDLVDPPRVNGVETTRPQSG